MSRFRYGVMNLLAGVAVGCATKDEGDLEGVGDDEHAGASLSLESSDGASGVDVTCEPLLQPGTSEPSGIEHCSNGSWQRTEVVACVGQTALPPESTGCVTPCDEFPVAGVCRSPAASPYSFCHYDCVSDSDCGPGAICICATGDDPGKGELLEVNQCVRANCTTAGDCDSGACGVSAGDCNVVDRAQCRMADDECSGHEDCPTDAVASTNADLCVSRGKGFVCSSACD